MTRAPRLIRLVLISLVLALLAGLAVGAAVLVGLNPLLEAWLRSLRLRGRSAPLGTSELWLLAKWLGLAAFMARMAECIGWNEPRRRRT
jgi:hypothetical protein